MRFNLTQLLGIAMLLLAVCLFFGIHMANRPSDLEWSEEKVVVRAPLVMHIHQPEDTLEVRQSKLEKLRQMQFEVIAEEEHWKRRRWQLFGSGILSLFLGSVCLIFGSIRRYSGDT